MKAAFLTGHGGNEVVAFGERPRPVRQPGEVCGATTGDQPPADIRRIFIRQLQVLGSTMGSLGEFRNLLSLVQHSGLKPVIDGEYALDDVHEALDRLESGRQFGKVVIRIGSNA